MPLNVVQENKAFVKVNTALENQILLPIVWVQEDLQYVLLEVYILSGTNEEIMEAKRTINLIKDLRNLQLKDKLAIDNPSIDQSLAELNKIL